MPVQTTYPGVYVQEVPSGVRTIAGVSTSVTAFIGEAKRGPINRAVTITSYSDFERRFGGLSVNSEMSFAVRQFFLNGGTQAIIVRVASNPAAAVVTLQNATPIDVLRITAADQGTEGNNIKVNVDYDTANPDSLFNLTVSYTDTTNPAANVVETYTNLSMNSFHARYVDTIVNNSSRLVTVARQVPPATLTGLAAATAESGGPLPAVNTLLDDTHNRFRIIINGSDPLTVQLNPLTDATNLTVLCQAIETSVQAQGPSPGPVGDFQCAPNVAGDRITMTSGEGGENSRIEILPGLGNDISARLQLSLAAGGRQIDAVSTVRPLEVPVPSTITSGDLAVADITTAPPLLDATAHQFRISIDGATPMLVNLPVAVLPGPAIDDYLDDLIPRIETAVRALRPASPGFSGFTCAAVPGTTPATDRRLVLRPGSRGSTSSIAITAEAGDNLAARLKLLVDGSANTATASQAIDILLQGGNEQPITDANRYDAYTGSQALRTGIYALEAMDIFNILCLPGIEDAGILMESDAYCKSRRAFMIVDAPHGVTQPDHMATTIAGTALPKSDSAAIYYPWTLVANPLNGGALRKTAPSGTIAGLYARIDGSRGVWKAPAGTEAKLTGVQKLDYVLTDRENGLLNPLGVNCLRIFPDAGAVSWGSRTLDGADATASEWKYIPVRRTALFIEESLYRGLKWVVFEPNDEPLWAQIRLNVGAFMHGLFRQGAFQGIKKSDAYFVKCDSETTTQNDINLGRVNIWVGFAPLKPAEFVILYLQQMAGQIQV
jgi:phage tail sheath protein FI